MEAHHICWVEKIDTESDEEYLSRARRLGSAMGVVVGRFQVGYRVSGKSDNPLPGVWIVESLPHDWDADTVQGLLRNHFADVHMLSQRRRRGDSDFSSVLLPRKIQMWLLCLRRLMRTRSCFGLGGPHLGECKRSSSKFIRLPPGTSVRIRLLR